MGSGVPASVGVWGYGVGGQSLWVTPWPQNPAPGGRVVLTEVGAHGWGSTLALTKSYLVSPQLQPRLTITATVSDGINNEVSAGARAGWLQGEGSPHGLVHGQGSVGRQLEAGG